MEIPLAMGLPDLRGIDLVEPVNLADLGRYIVVQSLERIIHITVFMHLPVDLPEVLIHEVDLHFIRDLPQAGMLIPVDDISLGGPPVGRIQKHLFDDVLNLLHRHDHAVEKSIGQVQDLDGHLARNFVVEFSRGHSGLGDGIGDLLGLEFNQTAITFADLGVHLFLRVVDFFLWRRQ